MPVRIPLCLPGRFRLAFAVNYEYPKMSFWLDELTVDNENGSFMTSEDASAILNCSVTNLLPEKSISCDAPVRSDGEVVFCGWQCQSAPASSSDLRCSVASVGAGEDYQVVSALKFDASGVTLEKKKKASVISEAFLVSTDSQLYISYVAVGTPFRIVVAVRNTDTPTHEDRFWLTVNETSFTEDVTQWLGHYISFPPHLDHRIVEVRITITFSIIKRDPPLPPVYFAIRSMWYTAEKGFGMNEQIDRLPVAASCDSSGYENVTCNFEHEVCDWQTSGLPLRNNSSISGWMWASETVQLRKTFPVADKSIQELHTSYHLPIKSQLQFAYRVDGRGHALLGLLIRTKENYFRLWHVPLTTHTQEGLGQWNTVLIDVCVKFPFQLVFQVAVAYGDTAIMLDDIVLQDECQPLEYNANCRQLDILTLPVGRIPVETEIKQQLNGELSCAFDNDHMCGWHNNDDTQLQWHSAEDPDASNNFVAKLEWDSSAIMLPSFAYLVGSQMPAHVIPNKVCDQLEFQFNISISNHQTVHVELYIAHSGSLKPESILWSSNSICSTNRTSSVVRLVLPEVDTAESSQFVFVATVVDTRGFVLLDDIRLNLITDQGKGWKIFLSVLFVAVLYTGCFFLTRKNTKVSDLNRQLLLGHVPLPLLEQYELPYWWLKFANQDLGKGRFGCVQVAWISQKQKISQAVAVKGLHPHHSIRDRDRFLAEMALFMKIGKHKNIVELIGVTTQDLTIVMENCVGGCLLEFVKKEDNFPSCNAFLHEEYCDDRDMSREATRLLVFPYDVARGMDFLANRHIMHGDLAARNILLDAKLRAKIANFGRARFEGDLEMVAENEDNPLPARWMAPEILTSGFGPCQCRSDVWSFGVLVWEIFTLGAKPYDDIVNTQDLTCAALLQYLQTGHRLPAPRLLPEALSGKVGSCWNISPEERPNFRELVVVFADALPTEVKDEYVACGDERAVT
ncbi:uncharacterized protein LOC129596008 isoform X2 [Paramacrobiotus metropolitanus]|uniref:uncharacterized protein LOC129596008 isoform X2 n=1 Tax=Paramacrobiotus metropolitanus TaxID=2943436 RepID=UPI0024457DB4|nr:uncharacterized protein LOC129596008 isoform X2 [Paramacrobiotus metropolitanus]